MPRNKITIPYGEVYEAAKNHVLAEGSAEIFRIRWDLARDKFGDRAKDQYGALTDTFCSQVLRALNTLAENGTLVKHAPHKNRITFYTQVAWAAKQKADEQYQAERAARVARWEAVYDTLTHAGFEVHSARGKHIALGLEGWETLAGLAGWSAEAGRRL